MVCTMYPRRSTAARADFKNAAASVNLASAFAGTTLTKAVIVRTGGAAWRAPENRIVARSIFMRATSGTIFVSAPRRAPRRQVLRHCAALRRHARTSPDRAMDDSAVGSGIHARPLDICDPPEKT